MTFQIPSEACVGEVRELVTARCGGGAVGAHIRMVRRFTRTLFLPLPDEDRVSDVLAGEEDLLLLGVDLAGVEADETEVHAASSSKNPNTLEATDASVDQTTETKDAASLLIGAMELLEDAEVQERLMGLSTSLLLAEWQPPWVLDGVDDLDAAALSNFPPSTVLSWAQSFSSLIDSMASGLEKGEAEEVEEVEVVEDECQEAPQEVEEVEDVDDMESAVLDGTGKHVCQDQDETKGAPTELSQAQAVEFDVFKDNP